MNELDMPTPATDPVCGMAVNREIASAQELTADYNGEAYFFCGRGCKLDFDENPAKFFEAGYQPSM